MYHITETGLQLLFGALALFIATRSPFHAFCVFVASLPFEYALAIRGPLTVAPVYMAALVLFIVCLTHPDRKKTKGSISSKLNPFVLAYVGIAVLSLSVTVIWPAPRIDANSALLKFRASEYRSVIQVAFLLFACATYFATLFFCSTARRLRFAVTLFITVSAMVALYGIYQMIGVQFRLPLVGVYAAGLYEQPASLRPNATFQEPMIFGHFLLAGMPLLASLLLHRKLLEPSDRRIYGVVAVAMLGVMTGALILTISRAAWLGAVASAAVWLAAMDRVSRRRAFVMMTLILCIAIATYVVLIGSPTAAWHTVANRFLETSSVGSEQRFWYRSLLMSLFLQYPVFGVGFGNYPLYQLARFDLTGIAGAYGIYWQSLVETGLLGFTSLLLMLSSAGRLIVRQMRINTGGPWHPYLLGWLASLTGLCVANLFMGDRLNFYMWVVLGFAMATVNIASETSAT